MRYSQWYLKCRPTAPPSLGAPVCPGLLPWQEKSLPPSVFFFFFFLQPFCFFMPSQGNLDPTVVLQDAVFVCRQVDPRRRGAVEVQKVAPGSLQPGNLIHRDPPSQGSSPGSAQSFSLRCPRKADRELDLCSSKGQVAVLGKEEEKQLNRRSGHRRRGVWLPVPWVRPALCVLDFLIVKKFSENA